MPRGQLNTDQDIEDFARGNDFMSANGGGPTTESVVHLKADLKHGLAIGWIDLGELNDDAWVASAWFSGSIAPTRYNRGPIEVEYNLRPTVTRPLVAALTRLESYLGVKFDALIPTEIGGNNTGHAVDTAVQTCKLLIDADYAGRAIPETMCITPAMAGKSLFPMTCANSYGDEIIVVNSSNQRMLERVKKHMAMACFGGVGCAGIALRGSEVKRLAVPGTVTRSLAIGRTIREARERGEDPVAGVARNLRDAWVLFRGIIDKRTWESRDGYMWGEHEISGAGAFAGRRMRIWFKNENHMTWLDDQPYVASPDTIEVVDDVTGEPIVNSFLEEGKRIGVIGIKRMPHYDTPQGIDVLGPKHWGFDVDYVPIEQQIN